MSATSVSPRLHHHLDPNRWRILAVLCLAVFTIVLDGTIVNVALPTFVRELGATTSQLQWIVDAYVLVFAGLLMAAGSLGDRFGRKGMLQAGLVLFGICSVFAAVATTPGQLIAWRGAMGVGAALLFPATLAILVNVFTDARERAVAIAVWAAASGIGVALGPVTGGLLLEHFWWGSVFLVNVPVVVVAALAVWRFVPTSRDPSIGRFDGLGTVLSIAAIGVTVWAVIEGPVHGWTSASSLASFGAAVVLVAAFVIWERRNPEPMLDVSVFTNMRFTAGSVAITFAFFALFGFIFVVTQYFQFVREYGALEAGLRTVPFALFTAGAAPFAAALAGRFGTKRVVAGGLTAMSVGFVWTTTLDVDSAYWVIVGQMALMGGGLGLAQAPATESIMGALPPERAGVGSAVNDTARELGGTLGVAVIGSVFASMYAGGVGDALRGTAVSEQEIDLAQSSVGAGIGIADQIAQSAGPAAGEVVRTAVHTSFLDGFHAGSWVSAAVVLIGALLALRYLPARAASDSQPDGDPHDHDASSDSPGRPTAPMSTASRSPGTRLGRARRNEVLQVRMEGQPSWP